MIREFHRNRAELILADIAQTILDNTEGIKVYVPIANPLSTFNHLIVSDGTGVIYVDHNVGYGPTLSCPLYDRQTGRLTASPFGMFNAAYNAYRQTRAELPKIQGILKLFHEEGWVRLRMGLLKFMENRHYIFTSYQDFRRWAGKDIAPTPYEEFVRRRGGDIRNFNTSIFDDTDQSEEFEGLDDD